MKLSNIFYFISVFMLVLFACQHKNKDDCKYIDGLKLYLKNEFKTDIESQTGERIYYIIPVNSCEPCVKLNVGMLSRVEPNSKLQIVLVGESNNEVIVGLMKTLTQKHKNCLYDKQEKAFLYEMGLAKPILCHLKDGNCHFSMQVSDFEVDNANKYLKDQL